MSANLGNVGRALSGEKHVSALAIVEGNTLGTDDFSRILKGFELIKTPLEGADAAPEPGSGGITLPTFGQIFPSPFGKIVSVPGGGGTDPGNEIPVFPEGERLSFSTYDLANYSAGWEGYTLRVYLPHQTLGRAKYFRLVLYTNDTQFKIGKMYVGHAHPTDPYQFAGTPIPVTFYGSSTVTATQYQVWVSDEINLPLDGESVIVSAWFPAGVSSAIPVASYPHPNFGSRIGYAYIQKDNAMGRFDSDYTAHPGHTALIKAVEVFRGIRDTIPVDPGQLTPFADLVMAEEPTWFCRHSETGGSEAINLAGENGEYVGTRERAVSAIYPNGGPAWATLGSSYVNVPKSVFPAGTNAYTLGIIFKPNTVLGYRALIDADTEGSNRYWQWRLSGNTLEHIQIVNGVNQHNYPNVTIEGEVLFLMVTVSATGEVVTYKNGTALGSYNQSIATYGIEHGIRIAARLAGDSFANFVISETMIFPRALGPMSVRDLARASNFMVDDSGSPGTPVDPGGNPTEPVDPTNPPTSEF